MAKKKKGNGKYHEWITKEGLLKIEGWARDGLTDEQIANNIGINVATLYRWKEKYCDLCEALKRGKEVIDRQVENALLKRALGYSYVETTEEPIKDLKTGDIKLGITKRVYKEVAPDVTAQIFWLKNRKPQQWRDKQEIESTNVNIDANDLTPEERKNRIAELKKKLIKDDNK